MDTRVDEIAAGIYRLSTLVPGVGGPQGLTFNQFLIDADEPLLFHCGQRALFDTVRAAVSRIMPVERLRWLGFSHVEADECGALDGWLAAAPQASAVHGRMGCRLWLNDVLARPPRQLDDDGLLDLGGRQVRWLDTPNVPHDLNAGLLCEETTGTLFCSDLFAQLGDRPPLTEQDILEPTLAALQVFPFTPATPDTGPILRRLAALAPRTLAVMHGASFRGEAGPLLDALAGHYEAKLRAAVAG